MWHIIPRNWVGCPTRLFVWRIRHATPRTRHSRYDEAHMTSNFRRLARVRFHVNTLPILIYSADWDAIETQCKLLHLTEFDTVMIQLELLFVLSLYSKYCQLNNEIELFTWDYFCWIRDVQCIHWYLSILILLFLCFGSFGCFFDYSVGQTIASFASVKTMFNEFTLAVF